MACSKDRTGVFQEACSFEIDYSCLRFASGHKWQAEQHCTNSIHAVNRQYPINTCQNRGSLSSARHYMIWWGVG